MFKDYYKILQVEKTASFEEIKTAYYTQSNKWHPDKNPNTDTTTMMQDINESYAILKDSKKRLRYDHEYELFIKSTSFETNSTCYIHREYQVNDEELKRYMKEAQLYAKKLVQEFFSSLKESSKGAALGFWDSIPRIIFAILLLLFFMAIKGNL